MDDQLNNEVRAILARVETRLQDEVASSLPFLDIAAKHIICAGGKRFRPLLVTLCGLLGDANADATRAKVRPHSDSRERLIDAALVVELTHVASLYHDDVMDDADVRRGVPSANARFGNSVAILVGDYLFAHASRIVAGLGADFVRIQAQTFAALVTGQIAELRGPSREDDPFEHYYEVLDGKTASLIATSALFGGLIAGLDAPQVTALERFGRKLGMAFQLADDLIDITSAAAGKPQGTDLREGVATLPVLLLNQSESLTDKLLYERILGGLAEDEIPIVLQALQGHPVVARSREIISEWATAARAELATLPNTPARAALGTLCAEAASRAS
ncbi:MAG: polyprenyl synthetase family protein [Propionibacteriaceae bacterium]|nr:polyprenyl synthetase family protein [Propionibacteriaceae bacterium]